MPQSPYFQPKVSHNPYALSSHGANETDDLALYARISDAVRAIPTSRQQHHKAQNVDVDALDPAIGVQHTADCHNVPAHKQQQTAARAVELIPAISAPVPLSPACVQVISDRYKRKRGAEGSTGLGKSSDRSTGLKFRNITVSVDSGLWTQEATAHPYQPPLDTERVSEEEEQGPARHSQHKKPFKPFRILLEQPQKPTTTATSVPPPTKASRTGTSHSILYRPASQASAKHSRAPVSTLFSRTKLEPEEFRALQERAKAFMLDERFPGRRSCVLGHASTSKGGTEDIGPTLESCVAEFLSRGVGEEIFGADRALGEEEVEDGGTQDRAERWTWPRDEEIIARLVSKVYRRVAGNERQRLYARTVRGKSKG